jgi:hypothetical protein
LVLQPTNNAEPSITVMTGFFHIIKSSLLFKIALHYHREM